MNKWSEQFNVEYPECNMCGKCCRCASPSFSYEDIKIRAEKGDKNAKSFLDIFIPYKTIEEAKNLFPDIVERTFKIAEKKGSTVRPEDLVFFHCRYIGEDNKCAIHQNRPDLCRSYPDNPFLVFAKGCAYEDWSNECKRKYKILMTELENIKAIRNEFVVLKEKQSDISPEEFLQKFKKAEEKYAQCIAILDENGLGSFGE